METLSNGDVTKWELIKALPYEVVLVKRRLNKDRAAYEKAYREIMTPPKT